MKRLVLLATPLLPLAALLAGCGGPSDAPSAAPSTAPSTAPSAQGSGSASAAGSPPASAAAFNPCDSLSAARVSRVLGTPLSMTKGTADTPRCALVPKKKGAPTFEMSYLWFDGGLDAAWKTLQDKPAGTVTDPHIKGADATKLIVQRSTKGYLVSAFMQNGDLIQSLNGVALPPYDAKAMDRATTEILTELSAGAPQR